MFFKKSLIILFVISIFNNASALIELPSVPDNEILKTEAAIRNTTNLLFSALNLTSLGKHKPRLKKYSIAHNYLALLTLKDHNNLKEIAKLTRINKNDDKKNITDLVSIINEILNEGPDIKKENNIDIEILTNNLRDVVDTYITNVKELKKVYSNFTKQRNLKDEVIKFFEEDTMNETMLNSTMFFESDSEEDYNITDHGDYWKQSGRRIFKGNRTKITHYPFVASVHVMNRFQCAGSIIKSDLVITAASCLQLAWNNRFFRENPRFLSVRIGSTYYIGGGEEIPVLEVYFHPSYTPKTLKDNLAIMRLHRRIEFDKKKGKKVRKIDIDRYPHSLPDNTQGITIVGWGSRVRANVITDPFVNRLSYAILDYYSFYDCQDIYSKEYVTNKHFCGGFITKGSGACNNDVGDPGIVNSILTGVVTFGAPVCGSPDAPTVFTKLGYYSDWIDEIMDQPVVEAHIITTTMIWPKWELPRRPTPPSPPPKLKPLRTLAPEDEQKMFEKMQQNELPQELFKKFLLTLFENESGNKGSEKISPIQSNLERMSPEKKEPLPLGDREIVNMQNNVERIKKNMKDLEQGFNEDQQDDLPRVTKGLFDDNPQIYDDDRERPELTTVTTISMLDSYESREELTTYAKKILEQATKSDTLGLKSTELRSLEEISEESGLFQKDDVQPKLQKDDDQPEFHKDYDQPEFQKDDDQSEVQNDDDQPEILKDFVQPKIQKHFDQPKFQKDDDQPKLQKDDDQSKLIEIDKKSTKSLNRKDTNYNPLAPDEGSDKDPNIKDIDEAILALLYLSDIENDNEDYTYKDNNDGGMSIEPFKDYTFRKDRK